MMFEVIVGNVGTVWRGDSHMQAAITYADYVQLSRDGSGRAAGEDVTLMKDGEILIAEHRGTLSSEEEVEQ